MSFTTRELDFITRMNRVGALSNPQTASTWLHDRATRDERRGLIRKLFRPGAVAATA